MKKITLCVITAVISSAMMAQVHFGLTAGTAFSNFTVKYGGTKVKNTSRTGFTAGVMLNVPMGGNLSFQPGFNFIQKGSKDDESSTNGGTSKLNLNYVEVPLNILCHIKGAGGNFFFGAGPSLSLGLSGKTIDEFNGQRDVENIKFGNTNDDDIKGLDLGANVIAGYEFKGGFLVAVNYNQGLSNLVPGDAGDAKFHSNYFGIRIGYLLKGKK